MESESKVTVALFMCRLAPGEPTRGMTQCRSSGRSVGCDIVESVHIEVNAILGEHEVVGINGWVGSRDGMTHRWSVC